MKDQRICGRRKSKSAYQDYERTFCYKQLHLDTYIDMSTVKIRHNNAREAAKVLAQEYVTSTYVDTIVCLDETSVIGAFLAEQLADSTHMALSHKNNISVITPGI